MASSRTRFSVPLGTFLAGVIVQLLAQELTTGLLDTPTRLIGAGLGGVILMIAILFLVVGTDVRERRQQILHVENTIATISQKLGISVEFIPDSPERDGMTYERTRQLISQAKKSLVFVDFWLETGSYREGYSGGPEKRNGYYDEILGQIRSRANQDLSGPPFHRRIIQLPSAPDGSGSIVLETDGAFDRYLRDCLRIQALTPQASVLKIAPPQIHMHFCVIDERYVVLPVLSSNPKVGGLRRHGALIFDDRGGELVGRLLKVYELLDAVAQPLEERHLPGSRA